MAQDIKMGRGKYRGLTKKQWKKQIGVPKGTTPGSMKSECCRATPLDKAMAKYPRSYKTMTSEYINHNIKKDCAAERTGTSFTPLIKLQQP